MVSANNFKAKAEAKQHDRNGYVLSSGPCLDPPHWQHFAMETTVPGPLPDGF